MSLSYSSKIFAGADKSIAVDSDHFDHFHIGAPSADFVLCRNQDGEATAIYGQDSWDFNPYRLSAKKVAVLRFDNIFESAGSEQDALILELKYLVFCLIYHVGSGRVGKLSVSTVASYFLWLRRAVRYCYDQRERPLVGVLSMRQLLENPIYLADFVSKNKKSQTFNKMFSAALSHLVAVGDEFLGYRVVRASDLSFGVVEAMQHPVIPTRIYIELINFFGDFLDQIYLGIDHLESFISCFADEFYGRPQATQKTLGVGGKAYWRSTFDEALAAHNLKKVFSGEFSCALGRTNLSASLLAMQYVVKSVIHLYTGMRDQEVMRLQYDCLGSESTRTELMDAHGVVRDRARMVSVLSTTTKFEGYRKKESWLATGEVVRAVEVSQAICRGLAVLYGIDVSQGCPLFLNTAILLNKKAEIGVGNIYKAGWCLSALKSIVIQPSDLLELAQTDPNRDFYSESKFAAGQPWPLVSHQFRRSLAFYASNSGFVSLPSLKSQYKHMTLEMTRYYANNFENLKTIFGYYDSDKKDFVLPVSHIALEFQMGIPMSVANQLLADVLSEGTPLFGGTGSYMEKQKARVECGEVCVEDVRAETLARVQSGDISYRQTLLGGCTKVGRCDSFLLGDFTECLSCEGAIIKPEKVDEAISSAKAEMASYQEGSGEYQITKSDLDNLVRFKTRLIDAVEV